MFLKFRYGQKPKTWGLSGRVQEVFGWFFCSKRGKRMKQAETKTPSRIKNNMPCVFVHIILPRYFFEEKTVAGSRVPVCLLRFSASCAIMVGQPMPIHFNSSTSKHLFAKIQRHKDQWRHKGEITGACGFTFLVGVHEEKTGRARKAQVWVPLQGFRFVGSQESRKQVKSENLKIH